MVVDYIDLKLIDMVGGEHLLKSNTPASVVTISDAILGA